MIGDTFWCKYGGHAVPVTRRKRAHECLQCAARRTPPVRVVNLDAPHRIPRKAPELPERKEWKK